MTSQPARAARDRPLVPERWRGPLAAGLAAAGVVVMLLFLQQWQLSRGWGYDFDAYYQAARRVAEAGSPYQEQTLGGPFRPGPGGLYLYSPPLAVLMQPLLALDFDTATWVWFGLRLVVLGATCALMPVAARYRLAVFGLALMTPPALEDLSLGNVSLIVTFFAVAAWRWLDRPAGGVAIAAAAALRPTMALVLAWWALRGRLSPLVGAALALVGLLLVTLPFVGIAGWFDYLAVLRNLSGITGVPRNFDLASFFVRIGAPDWSATVALYAGYAIALGAVAASLRRDRELSFVVVVGATLLLSPLLWNHYFTHTLITTAFLASRGRSWALALPLLTWLPQELFGFLAVLLTVAPLLAPSVGQPALTWSWPRLRRSALSP
jgi:hypothetical protein